MFAYDLLGVKKDACDVFGASVGAGSLRDWMGDTVGLPLMSETGSAVVGWVLVGPSLSVIVGRVLGSSVMCRLLVGPSLGEFVVDSSTALSSTSTAPSSTATSANALYTLPSCRVVGLLVQPHASVAKLEKYAHVSGVKTPTSAISAADEQTKDVVPTIMVDCGCVMSPSQRVHEEQP